jgi:hypothetical protein
MEHLVPPPKDLTTITPAITTSGRGGARNAAAIVPSVPEGPPPGGFRALVQQMRQLKESMSADTKSPAATTVATGPQSTNANPVARQERPAKPANPPAGSPYPPRRPRPARESAKLVRPQPSTGTDGGALPEDEISRAAKSSLNGKTLLPEQAIAQENAASNGVAGASMNGTNGTNGANGKPAASGNTSQSGSQSTSQSRPSGSNNPSNNPNYRKGAPGRRGGRPKGGR